MKVLTLNNISPVAGRTLGDGYVTDANAVAPDAIFLRAYNLHEYEFDANTKFVARCGAGVNNIPLDRCAKQGIIVCNTPGANSNAVKELVITYLMLCGRRVVPSINWAQSLTDGEKTVQEQVEKGKAAFVGHEIMGKTLGIVGLGGIGKKVARAAMALGMTVVFYEPRDVEKDADFPTGAIKLPLHEVFVQADYITLHVPLLDGTRGMINAQSIATMKDGVNIINTSRGELAIDDDVIAAVKSGKINRYCTDFPNAKLLGIDGILTSPHIGASTPEAEENCAEIAANQLKQFAEHKNVVNSVNFPSLSLATKGHAVLVLFEGAGEQFADVGKSWKLYDYAIKSNGNYGTAKFDFKEPVTAELFANIKGILKLYI